MLEHAGITVYCKEVIDIFETMSKADKSMKTIDNWVALVENHASNIGLKYDNPDDRIQMQNNFKGDMLEILAEIFFKNSPFDDRYGLKDYTVSDSLSDFGVDATGYNVDGNKCAVQCKYRANPNPKGDDQITYGDLAKTYTDGIKNHSCNLFEPHTLFLFTTANDCSYQIFNEFEKELVFIGRNQLSEIIHQNVSFWDICIEEIQDYLEN